MGDPRRLKKRYETPSHPWSAERIKREDELMRKYGLKNKREIWKAETILRKYRTRARQLLAKVGSEDPVYKREVKELLDHLLRMNLIKPGQGLDDCLALTVEDILKRRLQTIVYLKGLASSPRQARQLVVHGHISIRGRKVTVPGYLVRVDEENEIDYTSTSPLSDPSHPARPSTDMISKVKVSTEEG